MKGQLIILGLLFSMQVCGQNATKIIESDKKWYNHIYYYDNLGAMTTEVFAISSDTIINDTTYKKLLKGYHGIDPPTFNGGYIREIAGRLYYRINLISPERLVYDFNIAEGDTMNVFNYISFAEDLEEYQLVCDSIYNTP